MYDIHKYKYLNSYLKKCKVIYLFLEKKVIYLFFILVTFSKALAPK